MNTLHHLPTDTSHVSSGNSMYDWIKSMIIPDGAVIIYPINHQDRKMQLATQDVKENPKGIHDVAELIKRACALEGALVDDDRILMHMSDDHHEGFEVSVVNDDGLLYPAFVIVFTKECNK